MFAFSICFRIEFPYPKETPFKDKTSVVKDTNNPEYKHKIMIPVNIKEKACQRVFKRGAARIEVWSKGGFLRGDTLLGTATGINKNSFPKIPHPGLESKYPWSL